MMKAKSILLWTLLPLMLVGSKAWTDAIENLPLTEKKALELFYVTNPQIKVLRANIARALGKQRKSKILPNPNISIRREWDSSVEASVGWPLDVSGRRELRTLSAEKEVNIQENIAEWKIHSLSLDLKLSFYNLLFAQEHLKELKEAARRLEALIETVRSKGWTAPDHDPLVLERELAENRLDVQRSYLKLVEAQASLNKMLGDGQFRETLTVSGDFGLWNTVPERDRLYAALYLDNPRILALIATTEQKRIELSRVKRKWIPEINLELGVIRQSSGGQEQSGFIAGVSMDIPLFDRGQADVKVKSAELDIASYQIQSEQVQIRNDFDKSHSSVRLTRNLLKKQKTEVIPFAQGLEQISGIKYLQGDLGVLELIDAYRGGTRARLNLLEIKLKAKIAQIELERVMGRLLVL
jgi:cobalt-zinc-cadmium efflux system outer membrane protein